jgi:prevent-host-death family protein
MVTVGVRELKQQASELIRLVRETGGQVQVTYRGQVVALLVPVAPSHSNENEKHSWANLDALAERLGHTGQKESLLQRPSLRAGDDLSTGW